MIISHSRKFIYIKTPKTAGTSTEQYLSLFCNPDSGDEVTLPHPQSRFMEVPQKANPDSIKSLPECAPIQDIKQYLTRRFPERDIWNDYYKFVVIRNPWDFILSNAWYHYSQGFNKRKIKKRVKYLLSKMMGKPEIQFYIGDRITSCEKRKSKHFLNKVVLVRHALIESLDGEITCPVDTVIRYEELYSGLAEVCGRLGIPWHGRLEYGGVEIREKGDIRQDRRHYKEVYTSDQAERVGNIYKEFNEIFGYRY